MFSVPQDRDVEIRALRAGAGGFLSKNADIEAVARALRSVATGEAAVSRSLTNHLVELLRTTAENGSGMRPVKSPLTTRDLRRQLHTRDLGQAVPFRGHRVQPHQEHPAQAGRALAG